MHTLKYIRTILFVSTLLLLLSACNKDGVGIFYNVATEVKQNDSAVSELPVHQVIVAGTNVYVRTGLSVWKGDTDGGSWNKIASGGVSSIAFDGSNLHALFFEKDLSGSELKSYNGSSWSNVATYSNDGTIIPATGSNYAAFIVYGESTSDNTILVNDTQDDFGSFSDSGISNTLLLKAVKFPFDDFFYTISIDTLFKSSGANDPSGTYTSSSPSKDGDFSALSQSSNTNELYFGTSSGQVQSWDGTDYTDLGDADSAVVSLAAVSIGSGPTEYLIIGTESGYEEVDVENGGSITGPSSATSDTSGSAEFAAAYPDLAYAYIFDIAADGDEFFLATENGLWKRNSDGSFEKM